MTLLAELRLMDRIAKDRSAYYSAPRLPWARSMLLALCGLIGSCASAPADLVRINSDVNNRATYQHYAKKDLRYLKEGDAGNCATFAWTKFVDLAREGYSPQIKACVLTTGEGHAYVLVDGWALDNRFDYPVREEDVGCED